MMTNSEWWMWFWDLWGNIKEMVLQIDDWLGKKYKEVWNKENSDE